MFTPEVGLRVSLMFECHLTFDGIGKAEEVVLCDLAKRNGWKTSLIDGDPVLGPGVRLFWSAHAKTLEEMTAKMDLAASLVSPAPVRKKIEHVVYDTKYGIGV